MYIKVFYAVLGTQFPTNNILLKLFVQELKLNRGFDVYDIYCDNFICDMPCSLSNTKTSVQKIKIGGLIGLAFAVRLLYILFCSV